MIEFAGQLAGNDPDYNSLVEKLAQFVTSREGETAAAKILLRRAQKLDLEHHFDMIRLLGRAAISLTKKESSEQLVEALQLLTLAYRSAGLPWAARATCIFAAASIAVQAEERHRRAEDARPLVLGFVQHLPGGRCDHRMNLRMFRRSQMVGAHHAAKRVSEAAPRIRQEGRYAGQRLLRLGVEDVQNRADQERVAGLLPM